MVFALHTPAAQEAHDRPKEFHASDPPPQEASARKIRANFDERLQSRCSQPHGNACETPRRNNHPRRTENISLQKYAIFREAPLAKGEGDARRRVHKHIAAERVVKCYGMTLFSNKRGPFASSLEKRLLHAAGPCQRLFTSTKTCS